MGAKTPPFDGYDWLGKLMEAQASLEANQIWLMFCLGQMGPLSAIPEDHRDRDREQAMIEAARSDIGDFARAAGELTGVMQDLVANVERNLAARG